MRLSAISLAITRIDRAGAAGFSPLSLFASGEVGAWYDPSDLSTMFQDSAGTTPVTADGQPVGLILDKSGRGNHASQATTAARPLYKTDGTYHWLKFDGVDDTLSTAAIDLTGTDKISVFAGVRKTSGTPAYQNIVENTTLQGSFSVFGPGDSDNYYFTLGGTTRASLKTQNFVSPHLAVISLNFDISGATRATEIFPRVNSAIPTLTGADATDAGTGNFGNNILYLGSRNGNSLYNAGNVHSIIVRGALSTAQEITNTETWVNQRTGAY